VNANADALVIVGDGFDLAQAFSMGRIRNGHEGLVKDLDALARAMPVHYLWGNHEGNLQAVQSTFPFSCHHSLSLGGSIHIEHGNRFDWRNPPGDRAAFWGARAHAALERVIRTPVRVPMRKHYYWSTRLGHWLFFRYGRYRRLKADLHHRMGNKAWARHHRKFLEYWGGAEWGNPHDMLNPAQDFLAQLPGRILVCGHSHQAGILRFDTGTYINTGSWTYNDSTYVEYENGGFRVRDWITKRRIEDEEYHGILGPNRNKSFFDWWDAFYLGRFSYDVPAMKRAAQGKPPDGVS
jgi:UDP-2,3-diacylglucosamine pyrophosphatase LpxH